MKFSLALASCGPGWEQLLVDLNADLSVLSPGYEVAQIKEKFGTLRFYLDRREEGEIGEEMELRIREAERLSSITCDQCGGPGQLGVIRYWVSTRCEDCAPEGWLPNTNNE